MKLFKRKKKYDIAITYGTFDYFHKGHKRIIKRTAKYADKVIVGVASDEWNAAKGKTTHFTYEERKAEVENYKHTWKVIKEDIRHIDELADVWVKHQKEHNIDLFVMGGDHKGNLDFVKERGINIKYLNRTPFISSTKIRNKHDKKEGK